MDVKEEAERATDIKIYKRQEKLGLLDSTGGGEEAFIEDEQTPQQPWHARVLRGMVTGVGFLSDAYDLYDISLSFSIPTSLPLLLSLLSFLIHNHPTPPNRMYFMLITLRFSHIPSPPYTLTLHLTSLFLHSSHIFSSQIRDQRGDTYYWRDKGLSTYTRLQGCHSHFCVGRCCTGST